MNQMEVRYSNNSYVDLCKLYLTRVNKFFNLHRGKSLKYEYGKRYRIAAVPYNNLN